MVLRPGFGPGSPTRKAGILDRAILPEPEHIFKPNRINLFSPSSKKRQHSRVTNTKVALMTNNLKSPSSTNIGKGTIKGARSSVRTEHRTFNPGVTGSIPVGPANRRKHFSMLQHQKKVMLLDSNYQFITF
jgi:hypothetical protein